MHRFGAHPCCDTVQRSYQWPRRATATAWRRVGLKRAPSTHLKDHMDAPGTKRLFGIMEFSEEPIICAKDVLGSKTCISVDGIRGYLELPSLPDFRGDPQNALRTPLAPPSDAKTWKRGDTPMIWGFPTQFPFSIATVEKMLLSFDLAEAELRSSATRIDRGLKAWRKLFIELVELLTKQRRTWGVRILDPGHGLDLFCWSESGELERPYEPTSGRIELCSQSADGAMTLSQLQRICSLACAGNDLTLEYRIQLEAYRALNNSDYRKAIIETAVAAEIALTNAIRAQFASTGVAYGEKLIDKFRMLGGRLDLARIVHVELPTTVDLKARLVEPRNEVIHRADFANEQRALAAIDATDELLVSLSAMTEF